MSNRLLSVGFALMAMVLVALTTIGLFKELKDPTPPACTPAGCESAAPYIIFIMFGLAVLWWAIFEIPNWEDEKK